MEIKLNIPQYHSEHGAQSSWEEGFILETKIVNNDIVISANAAGLISLAKQLLTLAQASVPSGCHLHFDEYNSLESGSNELVIEKM